MKTEEELLHELVSCGIPWKVHGRDFKGMDCMGVVLWFFEQKGFTLPDPASRDPEVILNHKLTSLFKVENVEPFHPTPTGLIASYWDEGSKRKSNHIGVTCKGQVVHATSNRGVCATDVGFLKPTNFYRLNEEMAVRLQSNK